MQILFSGRVFLLRICIYPAEWGTTWHALRLGFWCGLPMALYCRLPSRWTAWLGLWALMDDAWAQLGDPVVQQLLLMFRFDVQASFPSFPPCCSLASGPSAQIEHPP